MLTDTAIRQLKPAASLYRRSDRDGLCLEVTPKGAKLWRLRYSWGGKATMISLGPYPEVTLAEARRRGFEARRLLANDQDPAQVKREKTKRVADAELSKFPTLAMQWLEDHEKAAEEKRKDRKQLSKKTLAKMRTIIVNDLVPAFRHANVATLGTPEAVTVLREIAARAPHTAVKAQGYLTKIIKEAIQKGVRAEGTMLTLGGVVNTPKAVHVPAATTELALAAVLKAIDGYEGDVVRAALKFASLTTMRPANIVETRWEDIDLINRTWTIPSEQMKNREEHAVSLPRQAIEILKEAQQWKNPGGWVFPAVAKQDTPHIHRDSLSNALRLMGMQGKHVPHGFRSSFRTIAREEFEIDVDVLEAQIAHMKKGQVNRAYDRAKFIKKRVEVMQQWADFLDKLRKLRG